MQDGGQAGIFVHPPVFDNFHDGERMDNVGVARLAKLTFVRLGGEVDGFLAPIGG